MSESDNEQAACGGGEDIWLEFEQHWQAMYAVCYRILRNRSEAEDATSAAILKALGNLPKKFTKDARSWLCAVARSVAIDRCNEIKEEQKFERAARAEVREDPFRVSQIQLDTRKLLERVMGLVDESLHDGVGLYFDVLFEHFTEEQLAEHHGVGLDTIKKKRRPARKAVRDAAAAVLLTTDPGVGSHRCVVPLGLARKRKDSPELLTTVLTHLRGCKRCQGRRTDQEALLKGILCVLPPAIGLVLDRLLRMSTPTKLAATTSVAVVAAILLLPGTTPSEPVDASPPAPTIEQSIPIEPTPAPSSTPPPPTTRPAPTEQPARPTDAPSSVPAPTTAVPPETGDGARDESRPAITDWWVQYRSIVATDDDRCGDEPTSSIVEVTVTPGTTSAVLLLTAYGQTFELQMHGSGSTWDGQIGPVPNEDARGSVGIAVRVGGANGASSVKQLGKICLRPCRTDQ